MKSFPLIFFPAALLILSLCPNPISTTNSPKRQINPENEYKRPEIFSYTAYRSEYRLEQELENYGSMNHFIQIKLKRGLFLETPNSDAFHLTSMIDWASIHLLHQEGLKTKNQRMSLQYYFSRWPNYIKESAAGPEKNILKINLEGPNQYGGVMTETYEICGRNLWSEPTYFVIHHDPSTQTYKLILFGDWANCKEFERIDESELLVTDSIVSYIDGWPVNWWPIVVIYQVIQNIHYDSLMLKPPDVNEFMNERADNLQILVILFEGSFAPQDIYSTTVLIPIIQRHTRNKRIMFYPEKWLFTLYVMLLQCNLPDIPIRKFLITLGVGYQQYVFACWRGWEKISRVCLIGIRVCILCFLCSLEYNILKTIFANQDWFLQLRIILFVFTKTYTLVNLLQQYELISRDSIKKMRRFKFLIKFLLMGIESEKERP